MFEKFLVQPLFNLLILIYNFLPLPDLGLVVILFTIFIRVLLWPLFLKSIRSQVVLNKIQSEVESLQRKYKDNKEEQMKQLLALYKNNNFNPFLSFLAIFVQLPILFAVYRVFWLITEDFSKYLYAWVAVPGALNHSFFNLFDLTQPIVWMALLASGAQFVQTVLIMRNPSAQAKPKNPQDLSAKFSKSFAYFSPILTFFIFKPLPSVLSVYWLVSTLISILQQFLAQKELAEKEARAATKPIN